MEVQDDIWRLKQYKGKKDVKGTRARGMVIRGMGTGRVYVCIRARGDTGGMRVRVRCALGAKRECLGLAGGEGGARDHLVFHVYARDRSSTREFIWVDACFKSSEGQAEEPTCHVRLQGSKAR